MPEIPAYPALSVLRADDVLPVLDVHDTSAAGTGTVKKATVATAMLLQPSTDTSGTTDTANIQQAVVAGQVLAPGTFYVSNLTVDTGNVLAGSGYGTILQPVSGTTGYVLGLAHAATSCRTTVRDLTINANNTCGGVGYDNTGFDPEVQWVPYDEMHSLRNVLVLGASGDAFHFDNQVRSMRVTDCIQYNCSGYGLYCGDGAASDGVGVTDNHFTNFISGHAGLDGMHFEAASGNNVVSGCKAFYSGYTEADGEWTSTTSSGFYNAGNWNRFQACSAQQNALHGFDLEACYYVTVDGCEADTNSAGTSVTTGCGINLNGVTNCSVTGCVGSNNSFDPPGAQAYGIQIGGTTANVLAIGNSVTGVNEGINVSGTYVNAGGNVFLDYTQAAIGSTAYLTAAPAAYVQGQTSAAAGEQYFAAFWNSDPSGAGYGRLATTTGAGLPGILQMGQAAAASAVTVASSAAIASLGSLSVPANDVIAGAVYRFELSGVFSIASANPATTYICDIRWGGTGGTLLTSLFSNGTPTSTLLPATTALSAVPILIEGEVDFRTSTTAVGWLRMTWRNSNTAATAPAVSLAVISSAVTVTTGSTESLSVDWTWGTSSASNTITIESSVFERVA
jgi:hypothetical protein